MERAELEWLAEDQVDIYDASGKVLYFSLRSFVEKIAWGSVCFICGAQPGTVTFNDEHVIPDWILSRHKLHGRLITLPNLADLKYGQYTVPCCQQCNSLMSETFEKPISDLVRQGYKAVINYLQEESPWLIFQWLSLIYLKTHLKDRHLRFHLDRRKGDETIATIYDWKELHHIHCIARSFYTGATLRPEVLGTLFVWPSRSLRSEETFDYGDSHHGRTVLLRLGDIAFIAVLNDSNAVASNFSESLNRLAGPLSSLQLRELMTRMAIANIHLAKRPTYRSDFEDVYANPELPNELQSKGAYTISAILPEAPVLEKLNEQMLGEMLLFNLEGLIRSLMPEQDQERLLAALARGNISFIFDDEGNFLINPKPVPEESVPAVSFRFRDVSPSKEGLP